MPISIPKFFQRAFAQNGGKQDVPITGDNSGGRASYDVGFPPVTRIPIVAGGIPPFGTDFNGILYDITSAIQYIQTGRSFPYNQDFADAIGGYGEGSLVSLESDLSVVYKSKVDNNLTPPPGVNWEITGTIAQATESVAGVAKIATQAQVNDGVDDSSFVTPKKLKLGVSFDVSGSTGFLSLPSWLGGVIFQWGTGSVATATDLTPISITFPVAFPTTARFSTIQSANASSKTNYVGSVLLTQTGLTSILADRSGGGVVSGNFYWLAIGT